MVFMVRLAFDLRQRYSRSNSKLKSMNLDTKLLAALASGVATCASPAITIIADAADAQARSTSTTGQATVSTFFAGTYYNAGPGLVPVFPFQLPTLAAGESFDTATLTLELTSLFGSTPTFNGDIVGLDRIASAPTVLGVDWGGAGTILEDNFYTPSSTASIGTTIDFASWMNTQYDGGANAGEYVFIRVDAEGSTSGRSAYVVASADNATAQVPTIDYTVAAIPEPTSASLLGLGCLALALRRRK